jgi:predicted metal-dependent phosphoesterase TrpH
MIDLHTHSTFSDGTLTPEALVEAASGIGLAALALTDHDCTDGHERFLAACAKTGMKGIGGVEISANVKEGTLHMLGYFLDGSNPEISRVLGEIRDGRRLRNERILDRLNGMGLKLDWEEVEALAGEDVVGRPHFAQAMVARGYVTDKTDAFDRYLAKGQPAYVDRFRLSPEDSIAAIRGAGGVAVLAHPFTLGVSDRALRGAILKLKDAGLGGIEAYYSEYTPEQQALYLRLAKETGLAVTGGSDFHGDMNPSVRLGVGFGGLRVPDELAGKLAELAGVRL